MTSDPRHERGCVQCGTCCRKGGPALHLEDVSRYAAGCPGKEHLVTFRSGELVYDNVRARVVRLESEIVRIRAKPGGTVCLLYDESAGGCSVYQNRPEECRVLQCWSPEGLMAMYDQDRAGRLDLVHSHSALGELIQEHETRCPCTGLGELVEALQGQSPQALSRLRGMLDFDRSMRLLLEERTGASAAVLEFLFGRPLTQVLEGFGVRISEQEGRIMVVPPR